MKKFVGALAAAVALVQGCVTGPVTIDGLFKANTSGTTGQPTAAPHATEVPAFASPSASPTAKGPAEVVVALDGRGGSHGAIGFGQKDIWILTFTITTDTDVELVAKRFSRIGTMPPDLGVLEDVRLRIDGAVVTRLARVTEDAADFGGIPLSLAKGTHKGVLIMNTNFAEKDREMLHEKVTGFMVDSTTFALKGTADGVIRIPQVRNWMTYCNTGSCNIAAPANPF